MSRPPGATRRELLKASAGASLVMSVPGAAPSQESFPFAARNSR